MSESANVIMLPQVEELVIKVSRRNDGAFAVKLVGSDKRSWTVPAFATDSVKKRIFSDVGDEIGQWLVRALGLGEGT